MRIELWRPEHHDKSNGYCSCFGLPSSEVEFSEQNFCQAQSDVDGFVIAICCCLSLCCGRRSCHTFQTTRVPGYVRHVRIGISAANSSSSGSAKMPSPRVARFREDSNLGSCITFHRNSRRTNSSQGARAFAESCVTTSPSCAAE